MELEEQDWYCGESRGNAKLAVPQTKTESSVSFSQIQEKHSKQCVNLNEALGTENNKPTPL